MRFVHLVRYLSLVCIFVATPAFAAKKKADAPLGTNPHVVFETTKGRIVIKLFADKAPISARNMVDYAQSGFYNGTIFHRVIPDFMMQGGGFDKALTQKTANAPIKNEADNGLTNKRGTVAMARTSVVDSATSQFFINFKDNQALDHTAQSFGYAVIGEVVDGMDVVESIRNTPTRCPSWTGEPCQDKLPPGLMDVPKEPIVITKAYKK